MALPEQTDEKKAIISMLSSIGERPPNNIYDSQRLDVVRARDTLNKVFVLALDRGWWFNTDKKVELVPNADGELEIPSDVLKVTPYYRYIKKFVKRGNRLFNNETRSFIDNTANLLVNYVLALEFDDCPESFKQYVAQRAGVIYQKHSVGSVTLFEFTKEDEAEAWGNLQQEEADQDTANLKEAPDQFDLNYRR